MKTKSILINILAVISVAAITARAETLFVSNIGNNTITRLDSSGTPTLFSSYQPGPEGLAFDSAGNLCVANEGVGAYPNYHDSIEKFDQAGVGTIFADESDGLYFPVGIAFDGNGNLFVSNGHSNAIVKISPTGVVSPFASSGLLNGAWHLACDSQGNVYAANYWGGNILKITPAGVATVFAGGISYPDGLAFDSAGNLYASGGNNTIMKFNSSGIGSIFATGLHGPAGLAFDKLGNLFVAMHDNNTIVKFHPPSNIATVFANSGLNQPISVAVESEVQAPTIICPEPLTLECTNGSAIGTMQVGVMDTNGLPLEVIWTVDGIVSQTNEISSGGTVTASNVTITANFGDGEHTIAVSASNGQTTPATCSTTVTVSDTVPPTVLDVSATPNSLWPPNHRMVPVTVAVSAIDACDSSLTARITNVTCNEEPGRFKPDWKITGPLTVDLRAERNGREDRIYTIYLDVSDSSGNTTTTTATVTVPNSLSLLH